MPELPFSFLFSIEESITVMVLPLTLEETACPLERLVIVTTPSDGMLNGRVTSNCAATMSSELSR